MNKAQATAVRRRWARMERLAEKSAIALSVVSRTKLRQIADRLSRALNHGADLHASLTALERRLRKLADRGTLRTYAEVDDDFADMIRELSKAIELLGVITRADKATEAPAPAAASAEVSPS